MLGRRDLFGQGFQRVTHKGTEDIHGDLVRLVGDLLCGLVWLSSAGGRAGDNRWPVANRCDDGSRELCGWFDTDGWRNGGIPGAGIAFRPAGNAGAGFQLRNPVDRDDQCVDLYFVPKDAIGMGDVERGDTGICCRNTGRNFMDRTGCP